MSPVAPHVSGEGLEPGAHGREGADAPQLAPRPEAREIAGASDLGAESGSQAREVWHIVLRAPDGSGGTSSGEQRGHGRGVDAVAVEEPLEIRIEGQPLGIVMRTPGDDEELVAGFCLGEGIIASADDLEAVRACPQNESGNAVDVRLAASARPRGLEALAAAARQLVVSSACGVCGSRSAEVIEARVGRVAWDVRLPAELIAMLPGRMQEAQRVFARTGGLHGAALFDASGRLIALREDIGRHNAVDKVIGRELLLGRLPFPGRILVASSRAGFEIVQKAATAGIAVLCAVGAPSTLAVDLARRLGMTLVGFARATGFNVYAGPERIAE